MNSLWTDYFDIRNVESVNILLSPMLPPVGNHVNSFSFPVKFQLLQTFVF